MSYTVLLVLSIFLTSSVDAFQEIEENDAFRHELLESILGKLQDKPDNDDTYPSPFSFENLNSFFSNVYPLRGGFVDDKNKRSHLYRIYNPIRLRETRPAQFGSTMNRPKQEEKIFSKLLRYG
jgi:hypothetical protein